MNVMKPHNHSSDHPANHHQPQPGHESHLMERENILTETAAHTEQKPQQHRNTITWRQISGKDSG